MIELNINELSEENIDFFSIEYKQIFEIVLQQLVSEQKTIENNVGYTPATISNLQITPKAKLLFLAKKIAKNALISAFTGIETMHLDSDTSNLFSKGYNYYMKQNIIDLIYSANKELQTSTKKMLEILNSDDIERKKDVVIKIYELYRECYGIDYGSGKKNANGEEWQFGLVLAALFKKVFDDKDLAEMLNAVWHRGVSVGPTYDFYKEICDVYDKYSDKKITKGR